MGVATTEQARHQPVIPAVPSDTEWRSLAVRTLVLVSEHDVI